VGLIIIVISLIYNFNLLDVFILAIETNSSIILLRLFFFAHFDSSVHLHSR
jgi:hypothetical protein